METLLQIAPIIAAMIAAVSVLIAAATFGKVLLEYIAQNKLKRYEKFQEMSGRFDENPHISKICELLLEPSDELARMSRYKKEVFICFMEEIAVMNNSGILHKDLMLYTFGYYAIKCYQSKEFWANIDKNEFFYSLFISFCEEMVAMRSSVTVDQMRMLRV